MYLVLTVLAPSATAYSVSVSVWSLGILNHTFSIFQSIYDCEKQNSLFIVTYSGIYFNSFIEFAHKHEFANTIMRGGW